MAWWLVEAEDGTNTNSAEFKVYTTVNGVKKYVKAESDFEYWKDEEGNTIPLTDAEKKAKADMAAEVLDKVVNADDPATAEWDTLVKEVDKKYLNEENGSIKPLYLTYINKFMD